MASDPGTLFARRRHGRFGAWLTGVVLAPPKNCYPGYSDRDYHRPVPMAWNLYRCNTCAAKVEPERRWHRLGWRLTRGKYDPFGRSRQTRSPW